MITKINTDKKLALLFLQLYYCAYNMICAEEKVAPLHPGSYIKEKVVQSSKEEGESL
jgi:hypothetical protein